MKFEKVMKIVEEAAEVKGEEEVVEVEEETVEEVLAGSDLGERAHVGRRYASGNQWGGCRAGGGVGYGGEECRG